MADIDTGGDGRKKGGAKKARTKKKSTRIDMTPMVDLGFLLITFFILTTTLNQPQAMNIVVPAKDDNVKEEQRSKVGDEQAFTILLGKNDRIWYYEGLFDDPNKKLDPIEVTWGGGPGSIRAALIKKSRERNPRYDEIKTLQDQLNIGEIDKETYKKEVKDITSYKMGIVVMVKAAPEATYENMVNILDELKIAKVGIYAIMDITKQELDLLKTLYEEPKE